MPRFTTAPIEDVLPQRRQRQPSERAQTREQYRQALQSAIEEGRALVIELDEGDKALTVRNRIKRAGDSLDIEDLTIRRKGNRIIAYQWTPQEEAVFEILESQEE